MASPPLFSPDRQTFMLPRRPLTALIRDYRSASPSAPFSRLQDGGQWALKKITVDMHRWIWKTVQVIIFLFSFYFFSSWKESSNHSLFLQDQDWEVFVCPQLVHYSVKTWDFAFSQRGRYWWTAFGAGALTRPLKDICWSGNGFGLYRTGKPAGLRKAPDVSLLSSFSVKGMRKHLAAKLWL